jgi:uracil-DNA glycosylase
MILICNKNGKTIQQEYDENRIRSLVSTKRCTERDDLCILEDKLMKYNSMWLFDELRNCPESFSKFMCNELDDEIPFQYLTTLSYSTKQDDILKLSKILSIFNDEYFKLLKLDKNKYNMPGGNINADVVFIGEAPGWKDDEEYGARVYTFGRSSILFRICSSIIYSGCWYTNIFKSAIINNQKVSGERLQTALEFLKQEVDIIGPKHIICLGRYAYDSVVGSFIDDYNVFMIYHPSYILRNGNDYDSYCKNMNTFKSLIDFIK